MTFKLPPSPPQAPSERPVVLPAPPPPGRDEKGLWLPGTPSPEEVALKNGRDSKGRFLAGASGNPRGRPVVAAELKKLAREYTEVGLRRLIKIIEDDNQPGSVHVSAVSLLWDRGYGKPVHHIEAGAPGAFDNMDDEALDAYIREKAQELLIDDAG